MSKKEYVLDSLFENIPDEDYNFSWSEHKERVRELLKLGAKGFCGGCLFVLLVLGMVASFSDESTMFADPSLVLLALFGGIGCIGFPYGWSLINRVVGNWSIFGNIIVVLAFFWFKAGFSLMLGIWVYPIVLIYNLIQSQKSKRKIRRAWLIIVALIVAWIMVGGILISLESSGDSNTNNGESIISTEITETPKIVTMHTILEDETMLNTVCQKALDGTLKKERECIDDYGWTITNPTQVHGVFYLEANNPENPYRNILEKLDVSNAIVVVTGYFAAEGSGIPINEWEMYAWVYPNFSFGENGVLSCDTENVYNDSLRSDDMEDFMDWFSSEYSKMNITELNIPSN